MECAATVSPSGFKHFWISNENKRLLNLKCLFSCFRCFSFVTIFFLLFPVLLSGSLPSIGIIVSFADHPKKNFLFFFLMVSVLVPVLLFAIKL